MIQRFRAVVVFLWDLKYLLRKKLHTFAKYLIYHNKEGQKNFFLNLMQHGILHHHYLRKYLL